MECLLTVKEIESVLQTEIFSLSNDVESICCTNVQTDSRNITEGSLFVPLIGEVQDGHKYIPEGIEKGAKIILVQENEFVTNKETYETLVKKYNDICFVTVKNNLYGLQNLAEYYVSKFSSLTKISITGSCGKTTTKEMLVSVFKAKYKDDVVYTMGNFNSETGLPLSVFNIRPNHKIGIFEMGMNRENEIGEIAKVLKPKYSIITNIGTAHIGILGSRQNIAKEKRKCFAYLENDGCAFVHSQDDYADYCTENLNCKIIKYGSDINKEISGVEFIKDNGIYGNEFTLNGKLIKLNLSGKHNYENVLGVIAMARELKVEDDFIKQGLENITNISGRMEIKKYLLSENRNVTIINDCYNANPSSMIKFVEFVNELDGFEKKIIVLADMKELGKKSRALHRQVGRAIRPFKYLADYIFLVGKEIKVCKRYCNKERVIYMKDSVENEIPYLLNNLNAVAVDNALIAFKGSHSMNLEGIIEQLINIKDGKKNE